MRQRSLLSQERNHTSVKHASPLCLVIEELERLEREDLITPVQFTDWAAPIVPVVKQDGKFLCICGDCKLTVNQVSKLDRYPIAHRKFVCKTSRRPVIHET